MKKLFTLTWAVMGLYNFISIPAEAQSPDKMSYQAVVRDGDEKLLSSSAVGMRISILQGSAAGTAIYVETHTPETNENGLVSIEIGTGVTDDDFSAIDWANGPYFIKTEADPAGGTNYTIAGTSQLLSVPYALYAETASGVINETDPVFDASLAAGLTVEDTTRWGASPLPIAEAGNILTFDGNNWVARDIVLAASGVGSGQAVNNMQPYLVLNYCIALQGIFPSRNSGEPFIGEIELYGFTFAPRGFAACDGQLLSIAQNSALFSLLGTIYGGDGRTTFGLPDLRGRVPVHRGSGSGLTPKSIGERQGSETIILDIANLPPHSHTISISFED